MPRSRESCQNVPWYQGVSDPPIKTQIYDFSYVQIGASGHWRVTCSDLHEAQFKPFVEAITMTLEELHPG